jgi:hypothetical protein
MAGGLTRQDVDIAILLLVLDALAGGGADDGVLRLDNVAQRLTNKEKKIYKREIRKCEEKGQQG